MSGRDVSIPDPDELCLCPAPARLEGIGDDARDRDRGTVGSTA